GVNQVGRAKSAAANLVDDPPERQIGVSRQGGEQVARSQPQRTILQTGRKDRRTAHRLKEKAAGVGRRQGWKLGPSYRFHAAGPLPAPGRRLHTAERPSAAEDAPCPLENRRRRSPYRRRCHHPPEGASCSSIINCSDGRAKMPPLCSTGFQPAQIAQRKVAITLRVMRRPATSADCSPSAAPG